MTLIVSINLLSCFVICSRIWSSPEVTIVIREMEGSSVGATDRLSILNPLPEKRPDILDSTPNSFSTSTVIVCFMVNS